MSGAEFGAMAIISAPDDARGGSTCKQGEPALDLVKPVGRIYTPAMTNQSTDWPLVRPNEPWPTQASNGGWAPAHDRVRLVSGERLHVSQWGDAVPGGYNGGFVVRETTDEQVIGRLDYQSAYSVDSVLVAWVEVIPLWRRRGLASMLVERLRHEFPGQKIEAGLLTEDGMEWWRKASDRWS